MFVEAEGAGKYISARAKEILREYGGICAFFCHLPIQSRTNTHLRWYRYNLICINLGGLVEYEDSWIPAGTMWQSPEQGKAAMRRHTVPNKAHTVILASVALAGLTVYANGESAQDHKNPNIPIFISLSSTTAAEGREDAKP